MSSIILALGQPMRISAGYLSAEEKGELLLKEEVRLDEGVGKRSVFEINDLLEEYGLVFETLDLEAPGFLGFDLEAIKRQAVYFPLERPRKGSFLILKRFALTGEEVVGKFIFPQTLRDLHWESLVPLVLDLEDFCGSEPIMVGFFYLYKAPEHREWLAQELRKVSPKHQLRFIRELEASLVAGRLPHGPDLPGKITFHPLLPLEADFEERFEAFLMEARGAEVECHTLEVVTEPVYLE